MLHFNSLGNFPEGEIQEHPGDFNTHRMQSDELRAKVAPITLINGLYPNEFATVTNRSLPFNIALLTVLTLHHLTTHTHTHTHTHTGPLG
jgi:hypothetical protein